MSAFDVIALVIVIWFCLQGHAVSWWRGRKPVKPQYRRRQSLAPCPIALWHRTTPYSSTQELYCHNCRKTYPWPLKPGQSPLVTSSKDRGIQS